MGYFTGILIKRKHGLDTYQVVVRNVVAHEFLSLQAAEHKLVWYSQKMKAMASENKLAWYHQQLKAV